ncbi:MAG: FecR domain-containing protein, partial [Prosthecobacter sp.]
MNRESLIHAKFDGEITPEQHTQLEALLRDDWQARRLYLELADQHARLMQQPAVNTGRLKQPSVMSRTVRWRTSALMASAAAIVLLTFIVWPRAAVYQEAISNGVAMVSDTLDADFAETAVRSGDTIAPGRLTLNKGLAQIEFFSGATVLIEGATQLEILSAWEARCVSGRVRVHVPPAAKGFLMHAPDVKLEDLGTEFALNVNGHNSAVHVFDGEVIAHTKDKAPASLKVGMTLGQTDAGFLPIGDVHDLVRQRQERRHAEWQKWSQEMCKDPRLVAYYTFKHWPDDRWDRLVKSYAIPPQKQRAGGAVGAKWTQGRWPG